MHTDIPKLVHMTEGRELIIPCRVTSPNITVTLKKVKLNNVTPSVVLLQTGTIAF